MNKLANLLWAAVVVSLVGFVGWRTLRPAAATPAIFEAGVRLSAAAERSKAEGKPVLAVVTADWCPPCQALKRGALADRRVAAFLAANTIPVYVDADANSDEAAALAVSSIPTTLVIRDGVVTARTTGAMGPDDYLAWLEGAVAPPAPGG